ncbi:MAG: steroid C26-monooxygenase Cyp142 [Synoicihabitans sp.]
MPCPFSDPFKAARDQDGALVNRFGDEDIPMLLRHADVRKAAKDWETFSSDAPFRVPVPSEEELRPMRQLPIETNPPEHTKYRALVEPFFRRAKDPEVIAKIESLVTRLFDNAFDRDSIEVINDFALPLQSTALTYLLNVDERESETWIGWGTHVFYDGDDKGTKGQVLDTYLRQRLDQAEADPGEDFFSALVTMDFEGRKLTRDEAMGFANLTFAGGRDTVIHSISGAFDIFAKKPDLLGYLRQGDKQIVSASEELFRILSPITHIGRVCPAATEISGQKIEADHRISLGWAAANFDETVFPDPTTVQLDRKPNPHVAFGFGPHLCIGAPHARLLLRTVLRQIAARVKSIEIRAAEEALETGPYTRSMGFERLEITLTPRTDIS